MSREPIESKDERQAEEQHRQHYDEHQRIDSMTDRERQLHVLEMVLKTTVIQNLLLPEELADLRSLLEDLKGEGDLFTLEELEVAFEDGQDHQMQIDNGMTEEQRLTFEKSIQYILEERKKKPKP